MLWFVVIDPQLCRASGGELTTLVVVECSRGCDPFVAKLIWALCVCQWRGVYLCAGEILKFDILLWHVDKHSVLLTA